MCNLRSVLAVVLLATALACQNSLADVIARYDFAGGLGVAAESSPSVTAGDYTALLGTISGSSLTHFINGDLTTTTLAPAAEFTVTPNLGMLDLTSLDFNYRTDNADGDDPGPLDEFQLAVRSSLDGFAADLYSEMRNGNDFPGTNTAPVSVDLTGAAFQGLTSPVTFRWFVADNTDTVNERSRIVPDVTLNGSIIGGAPELVLTVDRDNGELTLSNPGGSGLTFTGYEITSGFGSLDAANWTSIDDTYDVNGSGSPTISSDDWTELTGSNPDAPVNGDLSEFDFASNAGATLPGGASISLGVGTWIKTDNENINFTYALPDGTEVSPTVVFTGNGDVAFAEGDINTDGAINSLDWMVFRSNLGGEFLDESQAQAYRRGDLNGDLDVDPVDFINFRNLYEAANPGESFAAMVAATAQVSEPSTSSILAVCGCLGLLRLSRKRFGHRAQFFGIALLFLCAGGTAGVVQAQEETFEGFSVGTAFSSGAVVNPAFNTNWTFFDYAADGGTTTTTDTIWTVEDESGAGGSNALAQTNPSPDFLRGGAAMNQEPIGGAIAYSSQFDTSDPYMLYEWDFRFGGVALEAANQFLDAKFLFGTTSEYDHYSVNLVRGQTDGTNTQISISNTVPDGGDGAPLRSNIFNELPALSEAFPANSPLRASVIHDSVLGTVNLTITDLTDSSVIADRTVTNDAFIGAVGGDVGIGTNNDAFSVTRISAVPLPRLTLQVDPVDGDTRIVNSSGSPIDIDLYEITSSSDPAELDSVAWSSLEDQDLANFPAGTGIGDGWEEGGESDSDTLIEAFLTGSSMFADAASVYLGEAVADNVTQGDLSWRYHVPGSSALITGRLDFTAFDPPTSGPLGDFSGDGQVDGADLSLLLGFWGDSVPPIPTGWNGTPPTAPLVDGDDLSALLGTWGEGVGSAVGTASVPEPATVSLLILGATAMLVRRHSLQWLALGCCIFSMAAIGSSSQATEFDRTYKLGEETGENGAIGDIVGANNTLVAGATLDTNSPFVDLGGPTLEGGGDPRYADVSDRPGETAGALGVVFDGTGDFLAGRKFGNPETSRGAVGWDGTDNGTGLADLPGAKNYTGLRNRGLQLWVKPNSAGSGSQQSVIADTNQFGVLISDAATPTWLLDTGDNTVDSEIAVDFNQWTHVSVVRQFGVGTVLYLDGVAVTRASSAYDIEDTARLVLGSTTDGDEFTFSGGTGDYFNGIIDQVELFTWGESGEGPGGEPAEDFGDFFYASATDNFGINNGFASLPFAEGGLSGVAGDVNNDNTLDNADVTAFAAGWQNSNFVDFADDTNSVAPVGDLNSFAKGDLNFDGRTDISDAIILHQALIASGSGGLDFAALTNAPVPEPGSLFLVGCGTGLLAIRIRRRRQ